MLFHQRASAPALIGINELDPGLIQISGNISGEMNETATRVVATEQRRHRGKFSVLAATLSMSLSGVVMADLPQMQGAEAAPEQTSPDQSTPPYVLAADFPSGNIQFQSSNASELPMPPRSSTGFKTDFASSVAIVNVAITQATTNGYGQIFKASSEIGQFSNVNVMAGGTSPNLAFATTDSNGNAYVYTSGGGHVVVDQQGAISAAAFDDIPDMRIEDSRETSSLPLAANTYTKLTGRPNSTAAINLTAVDAVAAGYLQVLPSNTDSPGGYSNLNFMPGKTVGRLNFIKFNSQGEAFVYNSGATHVVADVQGYLINNAFDDTPDQRIIDTRVGASTGKLPADSQTIIRGRPNSTGILSLAATENENAGYLQVMSAGSTVGDSSSVNMEPAPGDYGGLAFVQFDANGEARIYNSAPTHLVADVQGYMQPGTFNDTQDRRLLDTREPGGNGNGFGVAQTASTDKALDIEDLDIVCGYHESAPGSNGFFREVILKFGNLIPFGNDVKYELYDPTGRPLSIATLAAGQTTAKFGFSSLYSGTSVADNLSGDMTVRKFLPAELNNPDNTKPTSKFKISISCPQTAGSIFVNF